MDPSNYDSLSNDAESSAETLYIMLHQEQTTYASRDYLSRSHHLHQELSSETMVSASDRTKLVDWCYDVVDSCEFNRENVAIAMDTVDRFLSIPSEVAKEALEDRRLFQLVAMTALYLAIKTNEQVVLGSCFFAKMSSMYTKQEIESMERAMLNGLCWRLCAPTSIQIAHHILSIILPQVSLDELTWGFLLDEVGYQTQHSVRDYHLTTQRKSTIAVASIFNAVDQIDCENRRAVLRSLIGIVNEDFDPPRKLIAVRNKLQDAVSCDEISLDSDEESASVTSKANEDINHHTSLRDVSLYEDAKKEHDIFQC
jgi:hypothetical protein